MIYCVYRPDYYGGKIDLITTNQNKALELFRNDNEYLLQLWKDDRIVSEILFSEITREYVLSDGFDRTYFDSQIYENLKIELSS